MKIEVTHQEMYDKGYREGYGNAMYEMEEKGLLSEWIPCSERLPNEDGDYIATYTFCDKQVVNKVHYSKHLGFFYNSVIAWMPLPEPYKEEGEAE